MAKKQSEDDEVTVMHDAGRNARRRRSPNKEKEDDDDVSCAICFQLRARRRLARLRPTRRRCVATPPHPPSSATHRAFPATPQPTTVIAAQR